MKKQALIIGFLMATSSLSATTGNDVVDNFLSDVQRTDQKKLAGLFSEQRNKDEKDGKGEKYKQDLICQFIGTVKSNSDIVGFSISAIKLSKLREICDEHKPERTLTKNAARPSKDGVLASNAQGTAVDRYNAGERNAVDSTAYTQAQQVAAEEAVRSERAAAKKAAEAERASANAEAREALASEEAATRTAVTTDEQGGLAALERSDQDQKEQIGRAEVAGAEISERANLAQKMASEARQSLIREEERMRLDAQESHGRAKETAAASEAYRVIMNGFAQGKTAVEAILAGDAIMKAEASAYAQLTEAEKRAQMASAEKAEFAELQKNAARSHAQIAELNARTALEAAQAKGYREILGTFTQGKAAVEAILAGRAIIQEEEARNRAEMAGAEQAEFTELRNSAGREHVQIAAQNSRAVRHEPVAKMERPAGPAADLMLSHQDDNIQTTSGMEEKLDSLLDEFNQLPEGSRSENDQTRVKINNAKNEINFLWHFILRSQDLYNKVELDKLKNSTIDEAIGYIEPHIEKSIEQTDAWKVKLRKDFAALQQNVATVIADARKVLGSTTPLALERPAGPAAAGEDRGRLAVAEDRDVQALSPEESADRLVFEKTSIEDQVPIIQSGLFSLPPSVASDPAVIAAEKSVVKILEGIDNLTAVVHTTAYEMKLENIERKDVATLIKEMAVVSKEKQNRYFIEKVEPLERQYRELKTALMDAYGKMEVLRKAYPPEKMLSDEERATERARDMALHHQRAAIPTDLAPKNVPLFQQLAHEPVAALERHAGPAAAGGDSVENSEQTWSTADYIRNAFSLLPFEKKLSINIEILGNLAKVVPQDPEYIRAQVIIANIQKRLSDIANDDDETIRTQETNRIYNEENKNLMIAYRIGSSLVDENSVESPVSASQEAEEREKYKKLYEQRRAASAAVRK